MHLGPRLGDLISVQIKLLRYFGYCHFTPNSGKGYISFER